MNICVCQEPITPGQTALIVDRFEHFHSGRGQSFNIIKREAEKVMGCAGSIVHPRCRELLREMRNKAYDIAKELVDDES